MTDGLSGTIGLVTSCLDTEYTRRLIAGAAEVLSASGLSPLCFSPGGSRTTEYEIPLEFLDLVDPQQLHGLIFSPPSIEHVDSSSPDSDSGNASAEPPRQYDAQTFLQRIGDLPAVCVGAGISGIASIWVQNGAGIRLLMKHLTEDCGRRRIAFIRGRENNVEAKSRFRAWEDFCVERSLPRGDELVERGDFTSQSGETAALRILEKCSGELPDAFLAANDRMALGVLRALRANNLSVPAEISVVGFDDLEAASADPPLTTIRQPVFEMGQRAGEILIAKLKKEPVSEENMITPELVVRASSQPNRQTLRPSTWQGSGIFLESAPPAALIPLLQSPLPDAPIGERVKYELEQQRVTALQGDPLTGIRSMRTFAVEQLEQALSDTSSLGEANDVVRSYLSLIGLQSLSVALLRDQAVPHEGFRLVVDCSVSELPPVGRLGEPFAGAQILVAHGHRTRGSLSVTQPVYEHGKYCGFLVASGKLLDDSMLHQLGAVLTNMAVRLVNAADAAGD